MITFIADENYKEETIFLTFSQDDTRVCFNVSIIDDNIHGVFFVNITTSDPQVTLSPHLTNLTIKSDDGIALMNYKQFPYLDPEKFYSIFYCEPPTIELILRCINSRSYYITYR